MFWDDIGVRTHSKMSTQLRRVSTHCRFLELLLCVCVVRVRGLIFLLFCFYFFSVSSTDCPPSHPISWSIHFFFISPNPIREVVKSRGKNVEMVR